MKLLYMWPKNWIFYITTIKKLWRAVWGLLFHVNQKTEYKFWIFQRFLVNLSISIHLFVRIRRERSSGFTVVVTQGSFIVPFELWRGVCVLLSHVIQKTEYEFWIFLRFLVNLSKSFCPSVKVFWIYCSSNSRLIFSSILI